MRTKLERGIPLLAVVMLLTVVMILGCGQAAHVQVNRPSQRLVPSRAEGQARVASAVPRLAEWNNWSNGNNWNRWSEWSKRGEWNNWSRWRQHRQPHRRSQQSESVVHEHCTAAERFLVADRGMVAVTEPDTIEDVRTRRTLPGCRVTAAGITSTGLAAEAERFYRRLRAAGWERTPNPIDAPNEASLRFRMGESDCLFNVYSGGLLGTPAEIEVNTAAVPELGETRYNVLVLCTPALEAAPRSEPLRDRGSAGTLSQGIART